MDKNTPEAKSLQKLDEISDCIKALASEADSDAIQRADRLLNKYDNSELKTKSDRTVLNKSSDSEPQTGGEQEAFMREIERDANERAERRKRSRLAADEWKAKGNEHFKLGDFDGAIESYSTGIRISKDYELLYQNRANCYVKLGKFDLALKDAEAAVFLTSNKSAKAFLQQARALIGLARFDEAREAYKMMAKCPDCAEGFAERCESELQRTEAARAEERRVLAAFNGEVDAGGDSSDLTPQQRLVQLIARVARGNQETLYYAGGLRCLAECVANGNSAAELRVLFRTKSGFNLLQKVSAVSDVLKPETTISDLQIDQLELLSSVMQLCAAVARDNEENCRQVQSVPNLTSRAVSAAAASATSTPTDAAGESRQSLALGAVLCLLTLCSSSEATADSVSGLEEVSGQLVPALLSVSSTQPQAGQLVQLLCANRSLQRRLAERQWPQRLLVACEAALKVAAAGGEQQLLGQSASVRALRQLAGSAACRRRLSANQKLVAACESLIGHLAPASSASSAHATLLSETLALAALLATEAAGVAAAAAWNKRQVSMAELALTVAAASQSACEAAVELRARALELLAELAARCPAVAKATAGRSAALLLPLLEASGREHPSANAALRLLAAAAAADDEVRVDIAGRQSAWLHLLHQMLALPGNDCLIGNAALCLSHCVRDTKLAERLAEMCADTGNDTDIVPLLLLRMRDCKAKEAKANCAILCGKLAQANHVIRDRLRQLDGVKILSDTLANNDIQLV